MESSSGGDGFTLVAAGDAIQMRPLEVLNHDGIDPLIRRIRDADASFVNVEQVIANYDDGYPTGLPGGGEKVANPRIVDDFEWAGFNLFGLANNHSNDLLHGGMLATMQAFEERNLTHAGLGTNLGEARAPGFLECAAGRVALISGVATPTPGSSAGRARQDFPGRPGVNPLRTRTKYIVEDRHLEWLRKLSEDIGLEKIRRRREELDTLSVPPDTDDDEFALLTSHAEGLTGIGPLRFEQGKEPGIDICLDSEDAEEYIRHIASASEHSDWVIASLHLHEGSNGRMNHWPPEYNQEFARNCIDAGADAVVGHGPHQLRGIELYDGKPIFYSLNSWAQQVGGMPRLSQESYRQSDLEIDALPGDVYRATADEDGYHGRFPDATWWESVLATCEYSAEGELERIELVPIDLQQHEPIHRCGTPVRATSRAAEGIIDNLIQYSEPYGTQIKFEDDIGVIDC